MSEEQKTELQDQDRYAHICTYIKRIGEEYREELFQAVEANEFETAFEYIETLRNLDTIFMLSMKRGMEIAEAKKKDWEKSPEGQAAMKAEQDRQQAEIDAAFAAREKLRKAKAELGMTEPETKQEAPTTN